MKMRSGRMRAGVCLGVLGLSATAFGQVLSTRGGTPQDPNTYPARGACGAVDITQNTDPNTVNIGTSIACFNGGNSCTVANDYARSFNLAVGATAGVAHYVRCVEYGVDEVLAPSGSTSVTVRLWIDSNGGAPNNANLVPLAGGSIVDLVPNGTAGALRTVDFTANNVLVPADAVLVVTVESPDLCTSPGPGNYYFNGSNAGGQSAPSYIRAPGCGLPDFASLAAIGFPNQHMVLSVELDPDMPAVPTVSEWGLVVLTLIGCVAGTIMFAGVRRKAAA